MQTQPVQTQSFPLPPATPASAAVPLRQIPINPNHWYVVAQSHEVTQHPHAITLWEQAIVLYRDDAGTVQALEDRCPHRQVKLSAGDVVNGRMVCAYHGWAFDSAGACVDVPYLSERQKLPTCTLRTYPVREQDGFIWLFPGEAEQAEATPPLGVPEWEHLNYIGSTAVIDVDCHFSFLIENLMDMYHGHLHGGAQVWANPELTELTATDAEVHAHYDAESYYRITSMASVAQLVVPGLRRLHPEPLDVYYTYPHWRASLGDDFKLYCLFCPIDATRTRAYLLHFTSLEQFPKLHRLPVWFRRAVKDRFTNSARFVLNRLVREDVLMLEQEQQAFLVEPQRRGPEPNRALGRVQQLMRHQAQTNTPSA